MVPSFPDRLGVYAAVPDAVAVELGRRQLTYRELSTRARRLAARLRAAGVGPDVVVGLCAPRSPDLVVGIVGILMAGAAWLPLDPDYPRERLAYMVSDSSLRLVLVAAGAEEGLSLRGVSVLQLAASDGDVVRPNDEGGLEDGGDHKQSLPENLAYVIYTSGSTGRPKAAMVTNRGLANLTEAVVQQFAAGPGKRVLQFAPASFDASVFELAMALGAGGTLVLPPVGTTVPGPGLVEMLRRERITHLTVPPSILAAMPHNELPALETVICAGESLPAALAARWVEGRRLFNAYGPTETTVWATLAEVRPGRARPSIGRQIEGVRVVILDESLSIASPGATGELAIGGAGVGRGYLGRPDLTADRFVPDPVAGSPGTRLYRTGDLARMREDGDIEFLGRRDHQVKVRGFRIELDEVASVLAEHPAVRDAVAVTRGPAGDPALIA